MQLCPAGLISLTALHGSASLPTWDLLHVFSLDIFMPEVSGSKGISGWLMTSVSLEAPIPSLLEKAAPCRHFDTDPVIPWSVPLPAPPTWALHTHHTDPGITSFCLRICRCTQGSPVCQLPETENSAHFAVFLYKPIASAQSACFPRLCTR